MNVIRACVTKTQLEINVSHGLVLNDMCVVGGYKTMCNLISRQIIINY